MRRPDHPCSEESGGAARAVVGRLRDGGVGRGDPVAVAVAPGVGLGLAVAGLDAPVAVATPDPAAVVAAVDEALRPRWTWWGRDTASELVGAGVRVATCWDLAAVHRLLFGGWKADPARVWARLHGLDTATIPAAGSLDLFSQLDDDGGDGPVRRDGHLRPDWVDGGWAASPDRLAGWAATALRAADRQRRLLAGADGSVDGDPAVPSPASGPPSRPAAAVVARAEATARADSTAELLCAELSADGLPVDRAEAERILTSVVGPRPRTEAEAAAQRTVRDAEVLRHLPDGSAFDLRSPGQVKSLLRRVGIEVADTRAWRLEALRDAHPVVEALLAWRKAERVATTYGYGWLDAHVGADGRLRGEWSGSDGAAGRMTATAGLHNLPADLRGAVAAEPGHVFVRADLGQIEPRVLAAVSGDRALAAATADDDMYAPVAAQLGVDRATAKVAVLGAMYGQTTGHGAQVLRRLESAYPVAMAYLAEGDRSGQVGRDLRTYGGRLVRMRAPAGDVPEREARGRAAAQGRYGRNALVQGAAAELFKVWAVTVRARAARFDARIVLCLHDELLVHTPEEHGAAVAQVVDACLQEAARRWAPDDAVRFVADVSVIRRWSDAKG